MYGTIPNFPCNTGLVCFGSAGVVRGKCAPGTCTTISWNTSNGSAGCTTADQNPPGGQCRHQQVCVIGFGATLQHPTRTYAAGGTYTSPEDYEPILGIRRHRADAPGATLVP